MLAIPAPGQSALQRFEREFRAAVDAGAAAATDRQFAAALQDFDAVESRIEELPDEFRGLARFWTGVRRAEILYHGGEELRMVRDALKTREAALAAPPFKEGRPVYGGYYRVLLLTLLWQAMPDVRFFELVEGEGEAEFLMAASTQEDVDQREPLLHVPLMMLRCALLQQRGQEAEASRILSDLADRLDTLPKVPPAWRVKCLESVAWLHIRRLDLDRAEVYLRLLAPSEALDLRSRLAYRRGDFPTAERLARELVVTQPGFRPFLGEILEDQEKWTEALEQHRQALNETDLGDLNARAVCFNNLGDCLLALGRLDEAERFYRDGLDALAAIDRGVSPELGQMQMDLGRLAEARGNRAAAYESFRAALTATEAWRREIPQDPLGTSWLSSYYVDPSIDGAIRNAGSDADAPWAALAATEHGKARGLLDWMVQPPRADGMDQLRAAVRRLALATDSGHLDERQLALDRARSLAQSFGLRTGAPLDAEGLRSALAAAGDQAVLSYWVGQNTAWLFGGRNGEIETLALGSREDALSHLRAAYGAVRRPDGDPWPALERAAAFFLPPVARGWFEDGETVVVCPDARLNLLPFEALPLERFPFGVIQRVERAPSLSVWAMLRERVSAGRAVVVVDDVQLAPGASEGIEVDPLEYSRLEGDLVVDDYDDPEVGADPITHLRGQDATIDGLEAALRAHPASLVHISAHAIASPVVPSRSLLLLAKGPVSMASLAALPFDGSVVVLSACSSASGEARGGEGVVGLLWGPMAGGARSVVASLWPVNQEATQVLMREFHDLRSFGRGESEALRVARARMTVDDRFAHPYYWAGFGVFGSFEENPVQRRREIPAWVTWMGVVSAALVVLWWFDRLRGARGRAPTGADPETTT